MWIQEGNNINCTANSDQSYWFLHSIHHFWCTLWWLATPLTMGKQYWLACQWKERWQRPVRPIPFVGYAMHSTSAGCRGCKWMCIWPKQGVAVASRWAGQCCILIRRHWHQFTDLGWWKVRLLWTGSEPKALNRCACDSRRVPRMRYNAPHLRNTTFFLHRWWASLEVLTWLAFFVFAKPSEVVCDESEYAWSFDRISSSPVGLICN